MFEFWRVVLSVLTPWVVQYFTYEYSGCCSGSFWNREWELRDELQAATTWLFTTNYHNIIIMADSASSPTPLVIYALDFDGVLVDSASETGQSGLMAARILFPDAPWIQSLDQDKAKMHSVIHRFCEVRPCLETGWEACLIIKLLADPEEGSPSSEAILATFQATQKSQLMTKLSLTKDTCDDALRTARNTWISKNNAKDWLGAHDFFEGACNAVQDLLNKKGNENVYVITTKAKEYAQRLMEQRGLYASDDSKIRESHIFGLGSGPKHQVLASILAERKADKAIMVEDNLKTLEKIMASEVKDNVIPVLASWGYNTKAHQETAKKYKYVVLSETNSSDLARALSYESLSLEMH
jgi:phosphoglycolate phosphatase-like HAD superfamily hydrolase